MRRLALLVFVTGCCGHVGWSWPQLPARHPNDPGVHRVQGTSCPDQEKFLYREDRPARGALVPYVWCRGSAR